MASGATCVAALVAVGYQRAPDGDFDGRLFLRRVPSDGAATHHLSLTAHGSAYWADHLALREALRASPELCERYGQLKRRLAAAYDDPETYTRAKPALIGDALLAAGQTPRSGWAAEQ